MQIEPFQLFYLLFWSEYAPDNDSVEVISLRDKHPQ